MFALYFYSLVTFVLVSKIEIKNITVECFEKKNILCEFLSFKQIFTNVWLKQMKMK